ncbi:hypothetical protein AB2L27_04590 [Kineococcus sp. LSe6-4]|uniref:Zinc ribbon domain-containing protein n=1 Tax=Kineococcus halophytocola TaxID=3234027 RepID=A0ABV4H015_9ACTN
MSQDSRAPQPTSFLDALHPATGEDTDLGWAPRRGPRPVTTTSAAFGGVEVGPPVSRLPVPAAEPAVEPAAEPAVEPAVEPAPAAVAPSRCPSCGSRTRPEEAWCSLCHTSLLPVPTPVPSPGPAPHPAPAPAPAAARVVEDADGQLALDLGAPERPAFDEAEADRMLGALSREGGAGVRGLGSRRAKVLVAAGGAAGLTALLLGAMAVLGAVVG